MGLHRVQACPAERRDELAEQGPVAGGTEHVGTHTAQGCETAGAGMASSDPRLSKVAGTRPWGHWPLSSLKLQATED